MRARSACGFPQTASHCPSSLPSPHPPRSLPPSAAAILQEEQGSLLETLQVMIRVWCFVCTNRTRCAGCGWLRPASARGGRAIRRLPAAVPRGSSAAARRCAAPARPRPPLRAAWRLFPSIAGKRLPPQTPTGTRYSIMTTKACDTLLCAQPPRHALVCVERLCNRLIKKRDRFVSIAKNQIAKPLVSLLAA